MKRVEMYYYGLLTNTDEIFTFRHWSDVLNFCKSTGYKRRLVTCCGTQEALDRWIAFQKDVFSPYSSDVYPVCYSRFYYNSSHYRLYTGYSIVLKGDIIRENIYAEDYLTPSYPLEGYVRMLISVATWIESQKFSNVTIIVPSLNTIQLLGGWAHLVDFTPSFRKTVREFLKYENITSFRISKLAEEDMHFKNLSKNLLLLKRKEETSI